MHAIDIQLGIVAILRRAARPVTPDLIAELYGLEVRAADRMIEELRGHGLLIRGSRAKGYMLSVRADGVPCALSQGERDALETALTLIERIGGESMRAHAKSLRGKLGFGLPDPELLQRLLDREPGAGPLDLGALHDAVRRAEWVILGYEDREGRLTRREVLPLIAEFSTPIRLHAWCALREDYREFRVDRIVWMRRTGRCDPDEAEALRPGLDDGEADPIFDDDVFGDRDGGPRF